MHENGFVTALLTTWSVFVQVERLSWERAQTHHGSRMATMCGKISESSSTATRALFLLAVMVED